MYKVNLTKEQLVIIQDLVSKEKINLLKSDNNNELMTVVKMNEYLKDLLRN
jgi:hypothetical protein